MQDQREAQVSLLTADEVGRRLGVDVSTVYRMAGDGRLSANDDVEAIINATDFMEISAGGQLLFI